MYKTLTGLVILAVEQSGIAYYGDPIPYEIGRSRGVVREDNKQDTSTYVNACSIRTRLDKTSNTTFGGFLKLCECGGLYIGLDLISSSSDLESACCHRIESFATSVS